MHPHDLEPEPMPEQTTVEALPGGPLLLRGNLQIAGERETRAALCSCGATANAPYCDGSGTCGSWPPRAWGFLRAPIDLKLALPRRGVGELLARGARRLPARRASVRA